VAGSMHRKQFSCFSIESLIGHQSRRTHVADDRGDSSTEEPRRSSARRVVVLGHASPSDRTWTAYDGLPTTEVDARTSPETLNDGPTTAWKHRCLPTVVAHDKSVLPINDQWTSQCHASDRHLRHGTVYTCRD